MEAAACARPATGYTYARRQPEKTALFQVFQQHLLTFEQQWTDQADGRTVPSFVTDELHAFLDCGILAKGFAHLYCDTCGEHHVVAFSCKARAVCPSCLGRRMSEGATDLVKYIRWSELLRRVFGIEVVCGKCRNPVRLIALIKTEETAKKILAAMHLPTEVPQLHPARPPPTPPTREAPSDEDWVN
jgi:hypothetical protein